MKIKSHLILMMAVGFIPLIFFSGKAIDTLFEAHQDAVLQGARERLYIDVLQADNILKSGLTVLKVLAISDNLKQENWAGFHDNAKAANADTKMVTVVLDYAGHQVMNTFVEYGVPLSQTFSTASLDAIFKLQGPQISRVFLGDLSKEKVISVYMLLTMPNGSHFILSQNIFAKHFNELLPPIEGQYANVHRIFDRDGALVGTNSTQTLTSVALHPDIHEKRRGDKEGIILGNGPNGEKIYTLFSRSPHSKWTFTLDVPVTNVEAAARRAVDLMLWGLLFVVLCATAVAVYFGRSLTRAIKDALNSAMSLSKNQVPSAHNPGIYEFEKLQTALHEAGLILREGELQRSDLLEREKAARASAETANSTKDEFLAMLGHELRNPLSPISSAAQLLTLNNPDKQKVKRTTDIILRQIQHITYLLDDLLDVSRLTRGLITLERNPLPMGRILADSIEQVRPAMEKAGHHFIANLPEENLFVLGDHKRLAQVFTNLLTNATKYTPSGGQVTLTMKTVDGLIVVTVADNGIGMSPDLLNRAFELFSQGARAPDRSQGGLGLGLALVKNLVTAHNGSVSAQSNGPGEGSVFTVLLPRLDRSAKSIVSQESDAFVTTKGLRLMVVDDNQDAANLLGEVLETLGHQVTILYDANSALERATNEVPDVWLLDIGLPGMDGNELARQLRAQTSTSETVLIAITGYGQEQDCKNALASGFDHHFVKPVDHEKLSKLLNDIAEK